MRDKRSIHIIRNNARLSEEQKSILNKRYSSLSLQPEKMKFIDRMVADSRQIALHAGVDE